MKILFIGDISGAPGRETLSKVLPKVKKQHSPDLVIANIENSAGGVGVTRETIDEAIRAGVDLCTSGDHTFRVKEFYHELSQDLPFIRPANYEALDLPGVGFKVIDLGPKGKVAVINILGQDGFTFNQRIRNPFWFIDELLEVEEVKSADVRLIDFHGEVTAEKLTFAWYAKDRVEAVVGTHTHVATADNRILGDKVAYVSDVGQVGPYEASLWVDFDIAIHNSKYPNRFPFKIAKSGPRIFNSVLIELENFSPKRIERVDVVVE